jgi:hypothetical protein
VTLADGQQQVKYIFRGFATYDGRKEVGTILLDADADEALAGIDFLRIFGLRLIVDPVSNHVELVPSAVAAPTGV